MRNPPQSVSRHFASLPPQAFVSFGGYTWVKPSAWHRYLSDAVHTHFPGDAASDWFISPDDRRWMENNCIFTSLKKYLFSSFGFLTPEESLFQIYNHHGEGVDAPEIIDACCSVVEPLGFQVDKVLVPDAELREGLGYPDLVVDIGHASEFHGQAGLCMINIQDGYSHAFYWKEMDQRKFQKAQFRIAVLLKHGIHSPKTAPSALRCFEEFTRLLLTSLPELKNTAWLQTEIECLTSEIHVDGNWENAEFRGHLNSQLESILSQFHGSVRSSPNPNTRRDIQFIADTGAMVSRIFRECDVIQ